MAWVIGTTVRPTVPPQLAATSLPRPPGGEGGVRGEVIRTVESGCATRRARPSSAGSTARTTPAARERPGEPGLPVILGEIGIDDEHRDALRRQPRKTLDDFVEESGGFRDRHLVIVEGGCGPHRHHAVGGQLSHGLRKAFDHEGMQLVAGEGPGDVHAREQFPGIPPRPLGEPRHGVGIERVDAVHPAQPVARQERPDRDGEPEPHDERHPLEQNQPSHQNPRTSPTTFPRILKSFCPCRTRIGAMVGCSGFSTIASPCRAKRFTVASLSRSATTMSPSSALCWRRTSTRSPSTMWALIMLSPRTLSAKTSSPLLASHSTPTGRVPSRFCSAKSGSPAAIRPYTGT